MTAFDLLLQQLFYLQQLFIGSNNLYLCSVYYAVELFYIVAVVSHHMDLALVDWFFCMV